MRIQHNIMAMNAYRNYNNNTSALSKNLEKLSSGYKINRAGDDAAGLAISEKMRAQITGLNAAQKNVKDGISLVKTAEGAMQEIQDMLNRMDYLATQSANGTYDNEVDRANLQKEVDALKTEINRIADSANFNGIKLLDGTQAAKAGETAAIDVTLNAVGTVTAGEVQSGGTMTAADLDQKGYFAPTSSNHTGLHETEESATQIDATFSIDVNDITLTGISSTATNVTIDIGGVTFSVAVSAGTAGANSTNGILAGASFAAAVSTTVDIGGVTFNVKGDATTGKITFTYATTNDSAAVAASVNAIINGAEVDVTASGGATSKVEGSWVHGVQDLTLARDKVAGELGGISLTLDENIVADGNVLKIGDQEFVFQLKSDDTTAADTTATNRINLSNFKGDDILKEAARLIAQSSVTITDASKNDTTFKISATNTSDPVIHIDQVKRTDGNADELYEAADLKGLFEVGTAETAAADASITIGATAGQADVAEGDQVTIGGKTYTIGTAKDGEDASKYLTADELNTKLGEAAKASLEEAAEKVLASKNYKGKYELTVDDATGNVTITATEGRRSDTEDVMKGIMKDIQKEVSLKVGTLAEDDIGKGGLKLQIGDTSDSFNQMSVKIGDMHTKAMGTGKTTLDGKEQEVTKTIADIDISSQAGAQEAVAVIKNAINYVSGIRGDLGAIQNRLEHTQNNLSVMAENIQDAESTIRDTDVADEMMSYVKNNILVQSAQAMLAQANQVPQGVLQLLG